MSGESEGSLADRRTWSHPDEAYRALTERHRAEVDTLEANVRRLETARLLTFLIGAVSGLLRDDLPVPRVIPTALSLLSLAAFVGLVVAHRRRAATLRRARVALDLARLGARRRERDWPGIASILRDVGHEDPLLEPHAGDDERHPYVADLDLFGPASVRALLGPAPTPTGTAFLRSWLLRPAEAAEVARRQAAVRALAPDVEGRARLATESLLLDRGDRRSWVGFLDWLETPPLFGGAVPTWALALARGAPPVTLALLVGWGLGSVPWWGWAIPLATQAFFARRWTRACSEYLEAASGRSTGLRRHHGLFAAWEAYRSDEPVVTALLARLTSDTGAVASREIRRLERWLDAADSRASMFHIVFAVVLLWDVHVAHGLELWRRRNVGHVRDWFDALGELEALSALATLAFDQPNWSMPTIRSGEAGLEAVGLGHPLLSDAARRTSDVRLGPPGSFLLVTGSNMSGKSTLLRAIGLAAVLGQAGSVVCAQRATLTPLRTFTSMKIHDSLTQGVSLFMAELLRLKALVDAADDAPPERALLYLIDEVLQGTNSEERRVAARRIVRHLLDAHAIGAVTTHDLSLHDDPKLDPASHKVHFRETVTEGDAPTLTFDYVLRPGLATSRNALKLLRMVGLDEASEA